MPRPLTILPLVLFAGIGAAMILSNDGTGQARAGWIDRPLPAMELAPMPGTDIAFTNDDLGGRVVLLNVFAAWCPSCREEHPFLMQLAGDGTVPIFGLNWKDSPGAGILFLNRDGNPYHATAEDRDGTYGALLGVTGVPETYVIDPSGRMRYRHLGPITHEIWSGTLLPLIEKLELET